MLFAGGLICSLTWGMIFSSMLSVNFYSIELRNVFFGGRIEAKVQEFLTDILIIFICLYFFLAYV